MPTIARIGAHDHQNTQQSRFMGLDAADSAAVSQAKNSAGVASAQHQAGDTGTEAITPAQEAAYRAEMNTQQQAIVRREAISQREDVEVRDARIPTNARSEAIMAHLKSLSQSLDAAAKKKSAPESQSQLISQP